MAFSKIPPMVNQIETHVLYQRKLDNEWMSKYGVIHEAWAPFGEGRNGLFENKLLKEIGEKYGKSTAQIMLRWNIQRGIVVIPKSTKKERIIENINIFDFILSAEDMKKISELDTSKSLFFSHNDPNTVEMFVKLIEDRKNSNK